MADDKGPAHSELTAELESKIEELARANLDLYETARQKSEFVANMSHELTTPLNSVIGFADVLAHDLKGKISDDEMRCLQNIRKAGYRLLEIISELTIFARIEAGTARANPGPVHVPGLLNEVVTDLRSGLTKILKIVVDVPSEMPTLMVDEVKLAQVIRNLGTNAVKFTPEGGCVNFRARLDGAFLVVVVRDSGIGIAPEDRRAIFRRFRQLDEGLARNYEGLGLGLYLVDALVRTLHGRVDVDSAPGQGSTFTVTVPVEILPL